MTFSFGFCYSVRESNSRTVPLRLRVSAVKIMAGGYSTWFMNDSKSSCLPLVFFGSPFFEA